MNEKQDIVTVSLHQIGLSAKESDEKNPQNTKLTCKMKDTTSNRDIYIYNGIDKYILYTLLKELE